MILVNNIVSHSENKPCMLPSVLAVKVKVKRSYMSVPTFIRLMCKLASESHQYIFEFRQLSEPKIRTQLSLSKVKVKGQGHNVTQCKCVVAFTPSQAYINSFFWSVRPIHVRTDRQTHVYNTHTRIRTDASKYNTFFASEVCAVIILQIKATVVHILRCRLCGCNEQASILHNNHYR